MAKTPGIGHNKPPKKKVPSKKGISKTEKQIRSAVKRIENLDEERRAISDDIREVYAEVKANGLDTKALRTMIQRRKRDRIELEEMEATLALYEDAMGGE